jgi:acyl dehydratase
MPDMTAMQIIDNLEALNGWVGREVAQSDWMTIDQQRIQQFADATDDHQWIHLDAERARRESPYKAPIAHGYLILSLLPAMFASCVHIDGVGMTINYGLDRVRLPAPVLAGQRVRGLLGLDRLDPVAGGVQAHWSCTVEVEHGDKPVCVAQMLARYYPASAT